MTAEVATVTSKGQVTIPKAIREALKIRQRDEVLLIVEGDHALLVPLRGRPLDELYGALPATRPYPGSDEIRRQVRDELARRRSGGSA